MSLNDYRGFHTSVDRAVIREGARIIESKAESTPGGNLIRCKCARVRCDGVVGRVIVCPGDLSTFCYG